MPKTINPKQYASLLYEITEDLAEKEVKIKIGKFVNLLAKNNNLALAPKIIKEFDVRFNKEKGVKEVEIISAKPLESAIIKKIKEIMGGGGKIDLREKIEPGLIGGAVIRVGDMMVDGSIKKRIKELNVNLR